MVDFLQTNENGRENKFLGDNILRPVTSLKHGDVTVSDFSVESSNSGYDMGVPFVFHFKITLKGWHVTPSVFFESRSVSSPLDCQEKCLENISTQDIRTARTAVTCAMSTLIS